MTWVPLVSEMDVRTDANVPLVTQIPQLTASHLAQPKR